MKKEKAQRKICSKCGKSQTLTSFYSSTSPLFNHDKKVPFCKLCLKEMAQEDDIDSVYATLRSIDKPFLKDVWSRARKSSNSTFGEYMRLTCSLHQYRDLNWNHSIFYDEQDMPNNKPDSLLDTVETNIDIDEVETEFGAIRVNKELKSKWGNYSNRDIIEMERLYQEMLYSNAIETPQHRKQLYFYCKLTILMDKALSEGDFAGFEKLSRQFDSLTKSSGFRPIDRKSSDEATGIRNFSTIFQEVERNGYIEPYSLEEHQDIVDYTIMYMANYTRKLLNMERLPVPPSDTPKVKEELNDNGTVL